MGKWTYIAIGAAILLLILFVVLPYFKKQKEERLAAEAKTDTYTKVVEESKNPTAVDYINAIGGIIGNVTTFLDTSGLTKNGKSTNNSADASYNAAYAAEHNH